MSEKPTKPRRDLRARLGKTITPKTPGSPGAPAPNVGGAAAPGTPAVKPPAGVAPPAGIAPPAAVTPPTAVTPPSFGSTPDVAPPPFAAPAAQPEAAPADPFAATAAAPEQQVVRLEFDDKLLTDADTGRSTKTLPIIAGVASLAIGIVLGWALSSHRSEAALFDRTMRDGQSIHAAVSESAKTMEQAQQRVNALITAAAGNAQAGEAPKVDYESIEALRALAKPLEWNDFTNKNYTAFTGTVHDLMRYAQNVEQIWSLIGSLAGETLAEARRTELDRTAGETGKAASTQYGAVLMRNEEGLVVGSLAFLEEGSGPGKILARPSRGASGRELSLYVGRNEEIGNTPEHIILIDGSSSTGVLSEQTGAFGRYVQRITELKRLVDSTVEVQGRVLESIGSVLNEAGVPLRAE